MTPARLYRFAISQHADTRLPPDGRPDWPRAVEEAARDWGVWAEGRRGGTAAGPSRTQSITSTSRCTRYAPPGAAQRATFPGRGNRPSRAGNRRTDRLDRLG